MIKYLHSKIRLRLWLLSGVFSCEWKELKWSLLITGGELLPHKAPSLGQIISGKANTRCSYDHTWHLPFSVSWLCFFCLGFILRQPFPSWWTRRVQQLQTHFLSAKQAQRRKECPFAQSSETQAWAHSTWLGLGWMLDPEPISGS